VVGNSRRDVLRFLAGVGVGAGIVEVYERLYNMPLLEERFRAEVSYWINEYNTARERLNQLEQEYNSAKETITNLTNEYNMVRERINQLEEQHNSTLKTISSMDRLEEESRQAIIHYRERMDEAIKALRNTVEKYRVILGDERVSFESSTLKVLEDLKLSQEKLLKLLPYFPLIRDLSWRPSRVVNDKIYDLEVSLEVISPLNTLAEVEVSLIPVEYEYFITNYGMRREDYPKAFPPEETKTVKLKPAGRERETFNIEFKDIVGGREYLIKAVAKDVADNANSEERKAPYIREFENIARLNDVTVVAFYYNWYFPGSGIPSDLPDKPLLGLYHSDDNVVFNKHVDWATGHGISVFCFPYPYPPPTIAFDFLERIFRKNIQAELFHQIKFSFLSTFVDNTSPQPPHNFDNPRVKQEFIDSINYIKEHYAKLPNFWRIDGRPVIVSWSTHAYQSPEDIKDAFEKVGSNRDVYMIGEIASNLAIDRRFYPFLQAQVYGIYNYQPVLGPFHPWEMDRWPRETNLSHILNDVISLMDGWSRFSRQLKIEYIPTISPGNDKTYDYRDNNRPPIVLGDPSTFQTFTNLVMSRWGRPKIIFVTSFNEWFEQTQIEPTGGYGFGYLEALYKGLK
jgi:DNA-binding ferritin-like protein